MEPRYLGDGVYASFNGFHIILETDGNTIYLEESVYAALVEYAKKCWVNLDTESKEG